MEFCLYATTFYAVDNGIRPDCPIGDNKPQWYLVKHPWQNQRLTQLMRQVAGAIVKANEERVLDMSAVMAEEHPERNYPPGTNEGFVVSDMDCISCGGRVQFKGDRLCADCKVKKWP